MTDAAQVAQRRTRAAIAALLTLLLVLAGVAIYSTARLYTTAQDRYVEEAFPLRAAANDLLLQMVNEETGVRGYLITGRRSSLAPYTQARPLVAANLDQLTRLSSRRPEIEPDVREARADVRDLDAYFARQIALVARGAASERQAEDNVLAGKERFDRFRATEARLTVRANAIVESAKRSQHRTFVDTLALALATACVAAAIALGLLLILPSRMRRLYASEQEARRAAEQGANAALALEHVDAAVALLDDNGLVRYWNRGAEHVLGVSSDDAVNRHAHDAIPSFANVEQALLAQPATVVPVMTVEGQRWLAGAQTTFAGGRVIVLRDVTEERQLERARSDFVSTASHELRTPLAAVYGAVRTLRRDDRPADPELDLRLLAMIESEADRLREIIEQILVSAEIDRGEVSVRAQTADLREICESTVASARMHAPSAISFTVDVPEGTIAQCDPARLRQVVANLVDNAVKYSPGGGAVELRAHAAGSRVRLEVADTGIGIDAGAHERIFEKFFRLDPEMSTGVGGSGLGLYISRGLVERMGGRLSVRSRPGEGSTFTIELPASAAVAGTAGR